MNERVDRTEWCDRVASAIVDGRILEDPGYWRPHVERCGTCRPRVEGLLTLRRLMERAGLEAPVRDVTPEQSARTHGVVFTRLRRRRRRQLAAGCVVALLAGGAAVLAVARPGERAEPHGDSVAYAQRLHQRVFAVAGQLDSGLLQRDEALRAEYVRALDDPSSLVRRTALTALALSNVPVDPARLERVLKEWSETLDTPVAVASATNAARAISDALEARRTETIKAALFGAVAQGAAAGARVSPQTLVTFLQDRSVDVRESALMALGQDPSFRAGEEVLSVLRDDAAVGVRREAAACLITRGGPEGVAAVVARLRETQEFEVEGYVVALLGHGAEATALARARVASEATPVRLALIHARHLFRGGERTPPEALVARALAGGPGAVEMLAEVASAADWAQYRPALQTAWRAESPSERGDAARTLARWDSRSSDPQRLRLALDICEAQRDPRLAEVVAALARSEVIDVRERALALQRDLPGR